MSRQERTRNAYDAVLVRGSSVGPSGGVICGREEMTLADGDGGGTREDLLGNFLCRPPFAGLGLDPVFHDVRMELTVYIPRGYNRLCRTKGL
jgi:hypothetical protein